MDDGTRKASKLAPQDYISRMPDNVVTNILDRLPLQDAVRTGILASNWRFKWTMLSQLVFGYDFFKYLLKTKSENSHVRVVISRLLLHLNGAITKCDLSRGFASDDDVDIEDEDISHWILFLSKKGIMDLTINLYYINPFKLPTHLFSCLKLKHLKLAYCHLNPPASFPGFPNLLSLELFRVRLESTELGEFITRCPLLEILKLIRSGEVKLVEIVKLKDLKRLFLSLCDLKTREITSSSAIFELLGSPPKVQELELDFPGCGVIQGFNNRLSIAFPCIKSLKLSRICLNYDMRLSCAFDLIWSFPNLQTLEITTCMWYPGSFPPVDYKTTGQLQLRNVKFEYAQCSENELCLLKYLLACSPFLKKIAIRSYSITDEKLKFAKKLLKLHRASLAVDIDLS